MLAATYWNDQILFDGVVRGLIYGLLAVAIILVYQSSRVINFAAGNLGLIGSSLVVLIGGIHGLPYWLALAVGLVVGTAVGGVVELVVVRRLVRSPRVILLVATIGLSQLAQVVPFIVLDDIDFSLRYPLAIGSSWNVDDITVKGSELMVLIVTPVVAAGLAWFLYRTHAGRTVRASADNFDLTRLSGADPKLHSTLVWAIAGLIATIAMVLLGGVEGGAGILSSLGPATLLRGLAAALVARFTSFGKAMVAAVVIGVAEQVIRFNISSQLGRAEALLLVVVLVAVAREERVAQRSESGSEFRFAPKVEPMPAQLRQIFWVRHLDRIALLVILAFGILAPIVITLPSRHVLYTSILASAICALSLTLLTGWAGQLSLGQMAFAGIAALTAAAFTRGLEIDWVIRDRQIIYLLVEPLPFALSIPLGALVAALFAGIVGAGALRVKGLTLAVSTFALAVAAGAYLYRLDVFSDGDGVAADFKRGSIAGVDLNDSRSYYYLTLAVLVVVTAFLARIRRSGVGRVTIAVRDNPTSAAAYTTRPEVAKVRAFVLAGAIAGLGGALIGGIREQIDFGDPRFLVDGSLRLVSIVVIGGLGSVAGALVGALWVIGLPAFFPESDIVPLLTSGIGLLVLLMYFPGGLLQIVYNVRGALYRRLERSHPAPTKSATAPPATVRRSDRVRPESDTPLRTHDITVTFGGVKANSEVSIEVHRGEIVGLIGTNGAGKTTLMNAIGGFVPATGRVELLGHDVSSRDAAQRARRGLGRTFQAATLFPELSVRETIEVAFEARGRSSLIETALFSPRARKRSRQRAADAAELIDFLGLGRYAERQISELSTGTRRIVELGGLLALDARVLCLDEPSAGVAQREAEVMAPLLVQINQELDASMLIIEHDMPMIMRMSDRVYCLELGEIIAEGDPETVRNDPVVIASYLGTDTRTIERSGAAPE